MKQVKYLCSEASYVFIRRKRVQYLWIDTWVDSGRVAEWHPHGSLNYFYGAFLLTNPCGILVQWIAFIFPEIFIWYNQIYFRVCQWQLKNVACHPCFLWLIILICLAHSPYFLYLRILPCVRTHLLAKVDPTKKASGWNVPWHNSPLVSKEPFCVCVVGKVSWLQERDLCDLDRA